MQWVALILMSWVCVGSLAAQIVMVLLPVMLYSHIRVLEEGVSTLQVIRSVLSIQERQENITKLQEVRRTLAGEVQVC